MIEFDIGGHAYRADKLNAFQQFHVSRKIAPLVPALIPVFLEVAKLAKLEGGIQTNFDAISPAMLQPFADGIAGLPDASAEYVMSTCLSVVRRRSADHWAPVWSSQANSMMFDDINNLGSMMPIVIRVIQENLGPFISGLLTSRQATLTAQRTSSGEASPAAKTGS